MAEAADGTQGIRRQRLSGVSEVTIPTLGEGKEYEELQAEILKGLYSVWFSHPNVETIVYWNQIDGHCYDAGPDSNWNENRCRGGIFHHDLTPKKAALALKKLITEDWHTALTITTDEEGYIEFRGFYGDYTAEWEGGSASFGIHKQTPRGVVLGPRAEGLWLASPTDQSSRRLTIS